MYYKPYVEPQWFSFLWISYKRVEQTAFNTSAASGLIKGLALQPQALMPFSKAFIGVFIEALILKLRVYLDPGRSAS